MSRVTAVPEESKADTMRHDRRNSVMYEDCPELRFIYIQFNISLTKVADLVTQLSDRTVEAFSQTRP